MQNICVFMGSNPGQDPRFERAAERLGTEIAKRGYGLIYGGARVGLMGKTADTVLEAGGKVYGVMPEALVQKEVAHKGLTELFVVNSMHERKAKMNDLADGFIALPGGFGTIEEIFEVMTWAQLGFHKKPCAFLDIAAYFSGIKAYMDTAVAQGFVHPFHRGMVVFSDDPTLILDKFETYEAPSVPKWIESKKQL